MIRELISELYTFYRQLAGTGSVIVMFLSALAVIVIVRKNRRGITPVLLSFCGCIASVAGTVVDKTFSCKKDSNKERILSTLFASMILILAITSSGTLIFSQSMSVAAENDMHLPAYIVEAADAVINDGVDGCVLTMPGWGPYFESYSSGYKIISPGQEDTSSSDEDIRTIAIQLYQVHPDMKKVASAAHRKGCGYVVLSDGIWPDVPITEFGYELLFETDGCRVYREVTP